MSVLIVEPPVESTPRLLTAADLAAFPEVLPSGPVRYELSDGELWIMAPAGGAHGSSQARVTGELLFQGERRGFGQVWVETGILLSRDPDTVLVPDAFFIVKACLPMQMSSEGYSLTIPNLTVEIRSKNDSIRSLQRKAERCVTAGVQLSWMLDPQQKTVTVLTSGAAPVELRETDTLTAGELIPGFSVRVADLFAL